ncbi:MAG: DUF6443 domain-containing protein [Cyclobacteriaceae bacterium]
MKLSIFKTSVSAAVESNSLGIAQMTLSRMSIFMFVLIMSLLLALTSTTGLAQTNPFYFPTSYNGQTGCSGGQVVSGSVSYFELRGYPASTVNATIGTYQLTGAGNWVEKGNVTVNGQVWGYKIYAKTWTSSGTVCMTIPGNPCMQTSSFTVVSGSGTPSLSATTSICVNTSYSDVTYSFPNSTYSNATLSPSSYGTISTINSTTRRITWNTTKPAGNVTFTLTGGNYACGDVPKSASVVFNRAAMNSYTVSVAGPGVICSGSGGSATFNASVTGTYGSLTYQWYKGGTAVSGSGSSYTVPIENLTNGVSIYCVVTSTGCSSGGVTSNYVYAGLTPTQTPNVSMSIDNSSYCSNETATLTASSSYEGGSTQYTWRRGGPGGTILGTGKNIVVGVSSTPGTAFKIAPGESIFLTATNLTGNCLNSTTANNTNSFSFTIIQAPAMPALQFRCNGASVELVRESGSDIFWQTSANGKSTANSVTTISNPTPQTYYLRRYNSGTGCWSDPKSITINANPTPGSATSSAGFAPFSNSSTVSGFAGTLVGWQKRIGSGVWYDIDDTSTTHQFTDLDKTSQFRAVFTNSEGCVRSYSAPGTVTIYPEPPVVALGQGGFSYGGGDVVTLGTNVYDTYQWYRDTTAISGSTGQTLQVTEPGIYKVEITKYGKTKQSAAYKVGSLGEQKSLNVVSTTRVRVPGVTESTDFYSLDRSEIAQSVKYDDGLGRTIQQVVVGQTPGGKDFIQPSTYDQYGRASKQYLPYAASDFGGGLRGTALSSGGNYTSSDQYLFYQNAPKVAHDTSPFAQSIFDDTPLGRLLEQGAPGAAWQPGTNHTVKNIFRVNTAGDNVRIWTTAGPKTTAPTTYVAGALNVSRTTDENGNEVLQFVDKLGRLLLKRVQVGETIEGVYTEYLDTYYVYDNRGNLALQIPPKAAYKIATGTAWNATFRDEWCFQYYYDEKNRLVDKKVPGSGIISYIYDPLDRIVLVQDAELKLTNKWLFVKYDSRQRPVMQGVYTNNTQVTRVNLQAGVADVLYTNPANPYFESRGTTLHGYTNVSFPTQNSDASALQIFSVNYYDNYDFDFSGTDDYAYETQGIPGESEQASARNLPTGSKKVIEGTSDWLVSYIFYDKYARPIQTRSNSHRVFDGADLMTRIYDFEGKVLKEISSHVQTKPLTWKNLVNVKVENNIISKTAGGAAWNAGTSSNEAIGAGQDGWMEIVAGETNANRMIGFSDVDSDQNYNSLDYAFYLTNSTALSIYENGASKSTISGGYATGTRLRIERKANTVKYFRNGTLVYTSLTPSTTSLMVDNALHTVGATLSEVTLSTSLAPLAVTKRYVYDFSGRPLHVFQSINGQPEILTVSYDYNELGQMVEKNLHCLDCYDQALSEHGNTIQATVTRDTYSSNETTLVAMESITLSPGFEVTAGNSFRAVVVPQEATAPAPGTGTYAQSVDMRYNIRGWLTSLNNAELTNDGTLNDDTGDYFGMELAYNTVDAGIGNTAYYNGNISAARWKNPLSGTGAEGQRSYKYVYDKSDRLKSGTFQARGVSLWDQDVNTLNESMTYDHNGNIKTLLRNTVDKTLDNNYNVTTAAQVMDNLTYSYTANNGNRLLKVEDSGTTDGFNNFDNSPSEMFYNANGSLVRDKNKNQTSATAITYNALGKPLTMTYGDGRSVRYLYDGAGNKLSMKLYQNATLLKTTDYVGGYLYENGKLAFFSSPGGRVIQKGQNFEYQYAITDHQGNTRVLFGTDTPDPDTYAATFEDNTQTDEQNTFQNYPGSGSRSNMELFDHTDFAGTTYTYSQLLNGGVNGQIGLAKTLKVFPGDTINASVYAKYWNETSTTSNLTGFATALTAAFGLTSGATGEMLKAYNALNDFGSVIVANNGSGSPSGPKAFITVLLFDNNFNFVDAAFDQIDPGAVQSGVVTKAAFDLLEVSYRVEKPGYAYIYLSNENPTLVDVYFDDMSISQTKSPVLQYNEYYPFGMQTMESWTRENTTNQFLYNSATELNSTTGFYDLAFRNYDPVLGRFVQVDPLADRFGSLSPYHYADDSPVVYNDPIGLKKTKEEREQKTPHSAPGQGGKDNTGGEYGVLYDMNQGGYFSRSFGAGYGSAGINDQGFARGDAHYEQKEAERQSEAISDSLEEYFAGHDMSYNSSTGTVTKYMYAGLSEFGDFGSMKGTTYILETEFEVEINFANPQSGAQSPSDDWNWFKTGVAIMGITQMSADIASHGARPMYTSINAHNATKALATNFSKKLGVAGMGVTVLDAALKGKWENHHTADLIIGGVTTFLLVSNPVTATIVGAYFLIDLGFQVTTGEGITEHLFD